MASRDPRDLHPELIRAWIKLKDRLLDEGYIAILTCTFRSNKEQNDLFALGRTKKGKIVTYARAGQSKHNKVPSEAFDIAILENGKLNWDLKSKCWQLAGKYGKELGLEWGGDWKRGTEGCHFQRS